MKKIVITSLVLGILCFGGWLVFNNPPKNVVISPAGKTELLATTSPIIVTALHSNVTLRETKLSRVQTIATSATTTAGSELKTSATGRALIESYATHTTLIDYNTDVVLTQSSEVEKKTSIQLLTGALWSRLEKVFDKGEFYEIKTNNAVAVVRGTSFGLWYSGNTTTLIVTDGSVSFSARNTESGEIISGSEILVTAGQKATWNGMGLIIVSTISSRDKQSPWFQYNNPHVTEISSTEATSTSSAISNPITGTIPSQTSASTQSVLTISSIVPTSVTSGTLVTIKGTGFLKIKSLVIGKISVSTYTTLSDTSIQFNTQGISAGAYIVSLIDLSNTIAQAPTQLSVTDPSTHTPNPNLR